MDIDEVREQIISAIDDTTFYHYEEFGNSGPIAIMDINSTGAADRILAIPAIEEGLRAVEKGWNAKVDREAELPPLPNTSDPHRCAPGSLTWERHMAAFRYQQEMVWAGWVKEVGQ